MLPEELVFILGFLALFGIPVLGVLAWGIWVVYDNEREEPPAGRGLTGWHALVLSVPVGIALMVPRMFFDVDRLWQLLMFLLVGAVLVAFSGCFTVERMAGPLIVAWGIMLGMTTTDLVILAFTPFDTGWEGLEYVFLLLGTVPALGVTALAVVWARVRRDGRALAC